MTPELSGFGGAEKGVRVLGRELGPGPGVSAESRDKRPELRLLTPASPCSPPFRLLPALRRNLFTSPGAPSPILQACGAAQAHQAPSSFQARAPDAPSSPL